MCVTKLGGYHWPLIPRARQVLRLGATPNRRDDNPGERRRSTPDRWTMTMQSKWMNRVSVAAAVLVVLAACEKHDAAATQAMGAISNVASQAGQKFDEAANYVAPHIDSVRNTAEQNLQSGTTLPSISASGVAATARANLEGAASSTNAAIVNAASDTGAGLEAAGHKLQQWSASSPSAGQGGGSGSAGSGAEPANTRTDMDK
jgi:hypothetical protein